VDRGAEHLCTVLMLLLFNALSSLLHTSPLAAVRTLTVVRVRELPLGRSALGMLGEGTVTLCVEPLAAPEDHEQLSIPPLRYALKQICSIAHERRGDRRFR
jgi:hypothetical protein